MRNVFALERLSTIQPVSDWAWLFEELTSNSLEGFNEVCQAVRGGSEQIK